MPQVSLVLCTLRQSIIWRQQWLLFPFVFLCLVHHEWLASNFQLLSRLQRLCVSVVLKNWYVLCHIRQLKIVIMSVQISASVLLQLSIVALVVVCSIVSGA